MAGTFMASFDDPLSSLSLPRNPGPNPADQVAQFILQNQQRPQAPMGGSQPQQQLSPPPPRSREPGGVKGILQSFFVGGSEALQKQLGIETPAEKAQREQETQQKREWQNSQLEMNHAQIENIHSEIQKRNQPVVPTPVPLDAQAFQYKINVEGKTPAQAYAEIKQEAQKPAAPPSHTAPSFDDYKADYLTRHPKASYQEITRAFRDDTKADKGTGEGRQERHFEVNTELKLSDDYRAEDAIKQYNTISRSYQNIKQAIASGSPAETSRQFSLKYSTRPLWCERENLLLRRMWEAFPENSEYLQQGNRRDTPDGRPAI